MKQDYPLVSVVIPVKNEAEILKRCLDSLHKLDYPKECIEIIIADGNSSDNTKEIAESYGAKVVLNEKEVVVSGRNVGFRESKGKFIAFTDADCTFNENWLKNAIKYFDDKKVGGVGGPTLLPEASTDFEKAIDLIFLLAERFSATIHRRKIFSVKETKDIPGCNAIYRREVLEKVMPVEETFLTAEDVWMNYCIRRHGFKLIMADDVLVWHHRRSSPKRFLRQIYRFSIGRIQVGMRHFKLFHPLHIIVGLILPIFIYLLFNTSFNLFFLFLISIVILFLFAFLKTKSVSVALNFLLVSFLFMLGWSGGFWRQILFPLKEIKGK